MTEPPLLAIPGFARVWVAGGFANAILWLETLAAALFTLQATHSPLYVAIVSAARAAPLLVVGAFVGVLADALDRRRIVLAGLLLTAASSAVICALAASGRLAPWHLAVAGLASGLVYATEMPARRRLLADLAGARSARAVALDILSSSATRGIGLLLSGVAVGAVGTAGTYALSVACSLAGAACVAGVRHAQPTRAIAWAGAVRDLRAGIAYARQDRTVTRLIAVTVVMNLCGYSYSSLVAPVGREMGLDAAGIGVLATAEPLGTLIGCLVLMRVVLPGRMLRWLAGCAALFLTMLACMPLAPALWPACALLGIGGLGAAVYANMQTNIVMQAVPPALRSRVFGLVTVGIGCWPLGQLLSGLVAGRVGPLGAWPALALGGLLALGVIMRRG